MRETGAHGFFDGLKIVNFGAILYLSRELTHFNVWVMSLPLIISRGGEGRIIHLDRIRKVSDFNKIGHVNNILKSLLNLFN